jgi:hypothetical protein
VSEASVERRVGRLVRAYVDSALVARLFAENPMEGASAPPGRSITVDLDHCLGKGQWGLLWHVVTDALQGDV